MPDATSAATALDPTGISEALGVAQTAYGIIKGINTDKKIKGLLAQRKSFQTPDEIFQILNATQSNAQGDTQTRDFQIGQLNNQSAQQLETAALLGGDPNDLSGIFGQKMQGIIQVGQQFHASNMEAFGKYLGALNTVAENKAAEWQSQQDILKDQIQALNGQQANNTKNISGGLNTLLSGLSADAQMQLYKELAAKNGATIPNITPNSATGTTGFQGNLDPLLLNRNTPNFTG